MGWVGGTLFEKYSLRRPSLKEAFARPKPHSRQSIRAATVVQCETPYTFGDWVSEYLGSLGPELPLSSPLLVPEPIADKPYARRDLDRLGIEVIEVHRPIFVEDATVIPKAKPAHHWSRREVEAYRRAFRIEPPTPRPGSVLYISREGERGEAVDRAYPSRRIAEMLEPLGARIVRARDTSQDEFGALAGEAETVIADHGAAMFNMLFWQPKRVIELFSDHFWTSCFLFLGRAMDVPEYRLIRVAPFDEAGFLRSIVSDLHAEEGV
jgi:capsular polysaccharide biosynthesis protein